MLSASSISRSANLSVETSQNPASSAIKNLQDQHGNRSSNSSAETSDIQQLDKSEINDAVTKVLQGYDWTLVPIASK